MQMLNINSKFYNHKTYIIFNNTHHIDFLLLSDGNNLYPTKDSNPKAKTAIPILP